MNGITFSAASTGRGDRSIDLLTLMADGRFHSGERLAGELGITRSAVWKLVARLRADGYEIDSVRGRGHRLRTPFEPLDPERIVTAMRRSLPGGRPLVVTAVPSTNSLLRDSAEMGGPARAVFAERQTAGRGRWGREWVSPPGGGLYLSVDWPYRQLPIGPTGLGLAVGVCLAEFLHRLGWVEVGLKWPNDLVCGTAKLGGILIELIGEPFGPCRAIVGVGVNWWIPETMRRCLDRDAAGLSQLGGDRKPDRNAVAAGLLDAVIEACESYPCHSDSLLGERWRRLDVLSGREIVVELPGGVLEGRAIGVDPQGALLLETRQGRKRLFSGETRLRVRPSEPRP